MNGRFVKIWQMNKPFTKRSPLRPSSVSLMIKYELWL